MSLFSPPVWDMRIIRVPSALFPIRLSRQNIVDVCFIGPNAIIKSDEA